MCEDELTPEIISLLKNALTESLENFNVVVHDESAAGQGYLAEILFISLTNKTSEEQHNFFIKQAIEASHPVDKAVMENAYFNEIYFYNNVWKTYDTFQRKFSRMKPFDKIPKFYGSSGDLCKQKFVLENLKFSGFSAIPRPKAFDENELKYILTEYGRFHGISAAFREHHPEEYKTLVDGLKDSTGDVFKMPGMKLYFLISMNDVLSVVKNDELKQKLEKYTTNPLQFAYEALKYEGKNPVFNHGDCWSNNIMVKYDKHDQLTDFRVLDFQLCRNGSVVSDISYLIYTGVSREILDNLDYFLKIYHDSFSRTLLAFDLEPSTIFTYEDLIKEWKDHCVFGFIMSTALWRTKLQLIVEKRNLVEVNDIIRSEKLEIPIQESTGKEEGVDMKTLLKIYADLVEHLSKTGYI